MDLSAPRSNSPVAVAARWRWLLVDENGHSKLWEFASRQLTSLDMVRCRFSPETNNMALAGLSTNGQLSLWSLPGQLPLAVATPSNACAFSLNAELAFSPDGRTLVGVKTNGDLTIWSFVDDVPRFVRTLTRYMASDCVLQFSPNGRVLAIGSGTNALAIWNWLKVAI
jgi:WD40 repeat protein